MHILKHDFIFTKSNSISSRGALILSPAGLFVCVIFKMIFILSFWSSGSYSFKNYTAAVLSQLSNMSTLQGSKYD